MEQNPLDDVRLQLGHSFIVLGDTAVVSGVVLGPEIADDGYSLDLWLFEHLAIAQCVVTSEEDGSFTGSEDEIGVANRCGCDSSE